MEQYSILGKIVVVVSLFNPPQRVVERCISWQHAIGPVIAVDDGSPNPKARQVLDALSAAGITVLANPRNAGIARALNIGLRRAMRDWDPEWILTMDQDSSLCEGYLEAAGNTFKSAQSPRYVGMLCAEWMGDVRVATEKDSKGMEEVTDPIQSGMLMRAAMIRDVGLFDESLVIDAVDSEYVARARECRWVPLCVVGGFLKHNLGETLPLSVCGKSVNLGGKPILIVYHAPFRTYYATRNQFIMIHRFAFRQPRRILRRTLKLAETQASMALFAPDRKMQRRAIIAGCWDGLLGRFGPIPASLGKTLGMASSGSRTASAARR